MAIFAELVGRTFIVKIEKGGIVSNRKKTPKEMNIAIPENIRNGVYANATYVTHTRDEFMLDFILTSYAGGAVTSRVIVSPRHMKKIIKALHENVSKYENKYGEILSPKSNSE